MDQAELLKSTVEILERLNIPYMITGSIASAIYGEPRFTRDIDIVIDPSESQLEQLCNSFPDNIYYLSRDAAFSALRHRTQFNVIDSGAGQKIDFIIRGASEHARSEMSRGRVVALDESLNASFASPEDVIISKIRFYEESGSDRHLRDIRGIIAVHGDGLDHDYIRAWCRKLGAEGIWDRLLTGN